jgi:NDP-sugar pyrophosphorylase family protein
MSSYVAAILAGGYGRRMGPLGRDYPKALLPIGDRPVIQHHLDLLAQLGIEDVFIVVGYHAANVVAALRDRPIAGMRLHFVEQGVPLGSAHALGRLRSHIEHPFLALLGDYYLATSSADGMLARLDGGSAAIAAKHERDRTLISQACSLEVDADGRVQRIVEKPLAPQSDLKGCGFYALPLASLDAVARTPRTALRDEYELSVSLELYLQSGFPLFAEKVVEWDANLTEPTDLLSCNLEWLRRRGRMEFIATGGTVEPTARLDRVIVGTGARVGAGARLEDVVVFPGAWVDDGQILRRSLVTPKALTHCP